MTTNGTINWQPIFDEALDYFVNYLQIDTTNPARQRKARRSLDGQDPLRGGHGS